MMVKPPLPETLVILVTYVGLICLAAHRLGLWTTDLISETVWWFVGTALVLLVNISVALKEAKFYRRVALEVLGITLLLDFLMNDLFVFSLPVELLLLPLLTFLAMLAVVAQMDPTKRQVASLIGCMQALAGLSIAVFVVVKAVSNWSEVTTEIHFLEFILPVWLTLAFLPFLYVISVLVAYESAFARIESSIRDQKGIPWRVKLALATVLGGRARYAAGFVGGWIEDAAAAGSFWATRSVVRDFRTSMEERERAESEARDQLEHFAGVRGKDDQGLELDRREFVETKKALRDLASAQMGWYRNRGNRYRADLLEIFAPNFTSTGLPDQHGIVMRVARDGQAWYAWRRTVTGWCFGIGASAPPPNQWEFDGPQPPKGFPGRDRSWGTDPFASGTGANWDEPAIDPKMDD